LGQSKGKRGLWQARFQKEAAKVRKRYVCFYVCKASVSRKVQEMGKYASAFTR
jgi:hypothetical protein